MTSARRKKRSAKARTLSVEQALAEVDDDLPDGAWMAWLEEMTGLDAGDISGELDRLSDHGKKTQVVAKDGTSTWVERARSGDLLAVLQKSGPPREVLVGQVWTRRDPNGAKVEFEVISITPGPFGKVAHGRIPSGKALKAGVKQMQTSYERFELVSSDRVRTS